MSSEIIATLHGKHDLTANIMYKVILALLPGIGVMLWLFGPVVLVQIFLALISAIFFETIVIYLRSRPIKPVITDGSAILTAILLAVCIPPIAPWWIIVIGTFFAIVFGKQLYGGLGNNILNPAMLGFVILVISFPQKISLWPDIGFYHDLSLNEQLLIIFSSGTVDAITGATPLGGLNTSLSQGLTTYDFYKLHELGVMGLKNWEYINMAFLAGGVYLLLARIITWHIPTAMLTSLILFSFVFKFFDDNVYADVGFHLFSGATMLGAFFIATDPITASTTNRGKLIYGFGIGALLYIIRNFGNFHDAVAFSVLLMNVAVPLIDAYTKPRSFGMNNQP